MSGAHEQCARLVESTPGQKFSNIFVNNNMDLCLCMSDLRNLIIELIRIYLWRK